MQPGPRTIWPDSCRPSSNRALARSLGQPWGPRFPVRIKAPDMKRALCAVVAVMAYAAAAPAQTQSNKPAPAVAAKPAPAAPKPATTPAAKTVAPQSASGKRPVTASATHRPATGTAAAGKVTPAKAGAVNGSHAKAASGSAAAKRGRKGRPAPRRPRQMAPAPERYQEIQQALVSKGYLKPEEASGVWDQNSSDALKRFQSEQKLPGTGKIDSLSLIALGLGPKHDSAEARPAPLPVPGQDPVQSR